MATKPVAPASRWKAFRIVGVIYGTATVVVGGSLYAGWNAYHRYQEANLPLSSRSLTAFHPIKITLTDVKRETTEMIRLKFQLPNSYDMMGDSVVSSVQICPPQVNSAFRRWYTPISTWDQRGEIEFLIHNYTGGSMCQFLSSLRVGDTLELRSWLREYPYKPNAKKHIGMIAAGSGITPMYQLLLAALSNPADTTQFSLLYSNMDEEHIALRKELDEMALKHPDRLKVHHNLMVPRQKGFQGTTGIIDSETIARTMPPPSEDTQLLICGPASLMSPLCGRSLHLFKALHCLLSAEYVQGRFSGILKDMGYKRENVYKFGLTEATMVIVM